VAALSLRVPVIGFFAPHPGDSFGDASDAVDPTKWLDSP
jgi:hypothetical protein